MPAHTRLNGFRQAVATISRDSDLAIEIDVLNGVK
jgi:hypothetical protein